MTKKVLANKITSHIVNALMSIYFLIFFALPAAWAQKPSNLPDANGEPLDIFGSVKNVLVYIVLPLIVLVLYLIWRKRTIKKHIEQQEQEKHQDAEEKEEKSSENQLNQ